MTLGRRLATQPVSGSGAFSGPGASAATGDGSGSAGSRRRARPRRDPRAELRRHLRESLARDLGKKLSEAENDADQLKAKVAEELDRMILERSHLLSEAERSALAQRLIDDVLGYGPIERMLADPDISEIMVNGTAGIYVERRGTLQLTNSRFESDDQLRQVIVRIAASVGRRIDESSPMVDARLADGSRVNAVIPPLAVDGPVLTIRKFSADTLTAADLVSYGSLTEDAVKLLAAAVGGRLNVVVSGGTGTGKTTFLNVLSSFIPAEDRIVTIEDAVELQLRQHHVIRLETRTANVEGRGAIGIRDLVRNSLRMRPDRIIVGECRGEEAIDMLQAMNTGHDGSLGTLHANSPADALTRLETMVLMSGLELPLTVVREQIGSAIDLIVQLDRLPTGARVVSSITEVTGYDGERLGLNPIFVRHYDPTDIEADGQDATLEPTGSPPGFALKLARHGVMLEPVPAPKSRPTETGSGSGTGPVGPGSVAAAPGTEGSAATGSAAAGTAADGSAPP